MSRAFLTRVAAASGALYVLLIIIGNTLATAGDTGGNHPSGAEVLRAVQHDATSATATAGFVLEVLGFVFFCLFLGYLAAVFAGSRDTSRSTDGFGGRVMAGTALVSGVMALAIKLASAAPAIVLVMDRGELDPTLARVLSDLNGAAFVVSWLPTALFVAATALALYDAGLVGRVLAYSGAFLGVVGVVLAIVGFKDPVGANPVAFLLSLLWVVAASARLAARPANPVPVIAVGRPTGSQPVPARS